jgi:hypothetical protein
MKDDYLWDKTGEPDPEIQQLEQILGTLRYQPKPLELPQDLVVPRRRNYFPLLAIAASLLLALLAGGIWLRTRSHQPMPHQAAKVETPTPKLEEKTQVPEPPRTESASNPPVVVAVTHKHRNKSASSAEALMAKQQLMLALRLTTEKLSVVQKKTQVRNQHKIG